MSQHVALSVILPNQASRSVPLDCIQPASASLQTALRSVELDPPQMNGVRFKTDRVLPTYIGKAIK